MAAARRLFFVSNNAAVVRSEGCAPCCDGKLCVLLESWFLFFLFLDGQSASI